MRVRVLFLTLLAAGLSSLGAAEEKADAVVVDRIAQDEFKKLHDAGDVVVVDVRSEEAYKAGHIPGAVSMPLDKIESHVQELKSAKKAIVTYCT
jgi:rhodanese-related sulfurtransferase